MAHMDEHLEADVVGDESEMSFENQGKSAEKEIWTSRTEFLLSAIGYAVGVGNVWRFPYLCFKYGGGTFLVPYLLSLLILGMPIFFLELGLGQMFSKGTFHSLQAIHPRLRGLGLAGVFMSAVVMVYYNILIAWSLYYLFNSFQSPLPWHTGLKASSLHGNTTTQAEDYWVHSVLHRSPSFSPTGGLVWPLVGTLLLAWLLVFLALRKGVSLSGKVVWVTATAPYLCLVVLFIRGVSLSGAAEGARFYLQPDWSKLADARVWIAAAGQIFYSLGPAWGTLVTYGAHNPKTEDIVQDTLIVPLLNSFTSVFAGFAIFCLLGHLAAAKGVSVVDVAASGEGLAFIVYPEGVSLLPAAPFFAVLFFLMLFCLGIDSQFGMVETVMTLCHDFGVKASKTKLTASVCVIGFLLGLLFVTESGIYWFELFDTYIALYGVFLVGAGECLGVAWVYGGEKLLDQITEATGRPSRHGFLRPTILALWAYVCPALLLLLFFASFATEAAITVGGKPVPTGPRVLGWLLALTPLLLAAACAVVTDFSPLFARVTGAAPSAGGGGGGIGSTAAVVCCSGDMGTATSSLPSSRSSSPSPSAAASADAEGEGMQLQLIASHAPASDAPLPPQGAEEEEQGEGQARV